MSVPITAKPAGLTAARYLKAAHTARGDPLSAAAYASAQNWLDGPQIANAFKAATSALSQAEYDSARAPVGLSLVQLADPLAVATRLPFIRVPLNTRIVNPTGSATASWIGEGQAKPIQSMALAGVMLEPRKVVAATVVSDELLRSVSIASDRLIATTLAQSLATAIDRALLNPQGDGDEATPASLLIDAPSFEATADVSADLGLLIESLVAGGSTLAAAAFVASPQAAVRLAMMRTTAGVPLFPGVTAAGGSINGLPLYISPGATLAGSPSGSILALIDAAQIAMGDESQSVVSLARHASIQMDDAPTGGESSLISLWQQNLIGILAERFISWHRTNANAVAYLTLPF